MARKPIVTPQPETVPVVVQPETAVVIQPAARAEATMATANYFEVRPTTPFMFKEVAFMPSRTYRVKSAIFNATDDINALGGAKKFKDLVADVKPIIEPE